MRALQVSQALLEQAQKRQPRAEDGDPRTLVEKVRAAADLVAQTTAAVLMTKLPPRSPDSVAAPGEDAEAALMAAEERKLLETVLEDCDAEDRALIDALYFRGVTMVDYAKQVERHKSTVSRHHARLMARLAKRMQRILETVPARRLLGEAPDPPDS
jgi:RNA polymerase sigma factor (sigma-70 family)